MGGRIHAAVVVALLVGAPALAQETQQASFGFGLSGGTFLGTRLAEHSFADPSSQDGAMLTQQVDLREMGALSATGEFYLGEHFSVRGHVTVADGRLDATTLTDSPAAASDEPFAGELSPYSSGFGHVSVRAVDASVSIWPWMPRSVGFAPFVTVGYGALRYTFEQPSGESFFRASGQRTLHGPVLGVGADMRIWHGVSLRFEAINHITPSPLEEQDFQIAGEPASGGEALGDGVSNIRFVLGAHVYFPFTDSFMVPE